MVLECGLGIQQANARVEMESENGFLCMNMGWDGA